MIVIPKSKNLGFCLHLAKETNFASTKHFRRFGIDKEFADQGVLVGLNSSSNRSLLSLSNQQLISEPYLNQLLRVARLLKVLDLENAPIEKAPEELGNLQHLQYLSLRWTKIKVLPKSIRKLWNLQTLDLKYSCIVELPKEVGQCCKLRHLLCNYNVKVEHGVLENLNELQTLERVKTDEGSVVYGLRHLKHLRTLKITMNRKEQGRQLCNAIEGMEHLRSLSIGSMSYIEILDIQHRTTPPLLLERLYLSGLLEKLPDWIAKLNNLAILGLYGSRLEEHPLTILQGLPNLAELTLAYNAFVGEKLDFGDIGFFKLVMLKLRHLNNLQSIVGLLPTLEDAHASNCPNLKIQSERLKKVFKER